MIKKCSVKLLLLVMISLLGLSCSKNYYQNQTVKKNVISKKEVVRLRWKKQLYSNISDFKIPGFYEKYDRFDPLETSSAAFDTDEKRIFIGAAVGGFYCIDIITGATIWRYDLDDPAGATPYYDSARKRVYFGADDGFLYALNSRSGRLIWSTDTGAELKRSIHMVDDSIYIQNADNTVMAIDPEQGEIIWRYRRPPVEGFSSSGYADLSFAGNKMYAGFADGFLVALDAGTGSEAWTADLAKEAMAIKRGDDVMLVDVDATPAVSQNTVIAASLAGGIYAFDKDSGTVLWTRPQLTGVSGMTIFDSNVIAVRSGKAGLISLDVKTGNTMVEAHFGLGIKSDPVVYDDLLLVSDTEGGLYFVSGGTGEILNRLDMDGGFFARPSEFAGYLIIMGNWTTLFSFAIN
ncbi:MAG: PQQ-binding-like beta-propeller repeat protein [Deltaproteobacteria bacterium]|nr:PQQ-binding-like beta-propeller repeat protein [Deltaproteobacteria bacterium]